MGRIFLEARSERPSEVLEVSIKISKALSGIDEFEAINNGSKIFSGRECSELPFILTQKNEDQLNKKEST